MASADKEDVQPLNLRVLCIDDDAEFIAVIADALKDEFGYEVFAVGGPREAIKTIATASRGIDVIVLDYYMREMNGLEFLRWMREQNNPIPIVMLTATGSEAIAVEAMKLGAYDYMRKEHLEITHLGHTLAATSERREYRVMREMDREQLTEMILNARATDKAREVLNTITPPLNTALASLDFEVEVKGVELLQSLEPSSRINVQAFLDRMLKDIQTLEMSVRGLLMLYRNFYVLHDEEEEVEEVRKEIEIALQKRRL